MSYQLNINIKEELQHLNSKELFEFMIERFEKQYDESKNRFNILTKLKKHRKITNCYNFIELYDDTFYNFIHFCEDMLDVYEMEDRESFSKLIKLIMTSYNCYDLVFKFNGIIEEDWFESKYWTEIEEDLEDIFNDEIDKLYHDKRKKNAVKVIENHFLKAFYSPYTELGIRRFNKELDKLDIN